MAYNLRPSNRQKLSTLQRGTLIIGGVSIMAVAAYMTVVMNTADVTESQAGINLMEQDPVNNGEVVVGYSWDINPVTKADYGPNAISCSPNATCIAGSFDNSFGLSAGHGLKPINLEIKPVEGMNADGIDIAIDYRRTEAEGNFYSRGKDFNFGIDEGKLCIRYRLTAPNGKSYLVDETTRYEIPEDQTFRNYRFIYTPATGRGEILVDKATVWTNQAAEQSRITWKTGENVIIGEGMNGDGKPMPVFDNLVVRRTGQSNLSPMQLLSFTAELQDKIVMLNWYTAKENGTDYYKIERSQDTKTYTEIGRVKASGKSETLKAYALVDKEPVIGISYYRLALTNGNAHSIWVPVIAIRLKPEQIITTPLAPTTSSGK
ncbi:MAG: hypothetical protein U0Y08_05225 [Bacteroidia bacterium]